MSNFIIRRLVISAFIIVLLSLATFFLLRVAPGDAALLASGGGFIPKEQVEAQREELGLNKPYFFVSFETSPPFVAWNNDNQYWSWAGNILQGDAGKANLTKTPVTKSVIDRMPATIELLVLTMLFTILLGIPAGVICALYRNTPIDLVVRFSAILSLSIPSFWLATMVLIIPSQLWGYAPPLTGGTVSIFEHPWDNLRQFVPPSLVLGTAASATVMRLTRSSLLEVLRADYVRTARAKGLRDSLVVYRHALKNVLIPVITILGLQFTGLLGGTLFIELIFNIKGLGLYTFENILRKDYTVVQSMTLYIGAVVILTQLAIDVSYAWIDPPDSILMSTTPTTLGIEQILAGEHDELPPGVSSGRKLLRLSRQNPLGAFGAIVIAVLLFVGILGPGITVSLPGGVTILSTPRLTEYSYRQIGVGLPLEDPSLDHPFGTDKSGRDMLGRVVAGARVSLLVGFVSVIGGIAIGMVIGIFSGYSGGWIDNFIQRMVDTVIAFPGLVLLLILMSVFAPSIETVILVIMLLTIFPTIRITRGATLSERNNQYVEASRSIGASSSRILFRHLLPNILPLGIVLMTTSLGAAILAESALSFLGLGIPEPNPSWGRDISTGRNSFPIHVWWPLFPGVAISLTVLAFNLLGDSIRDIFDPRLRGSR